LTPSILVIDSGVGGLSVCQAILAKQKGIRLVYFADDAFFPYGLMEESKLRARLKDIVGEMLKLHQPELVVLACNTVSTLVLPELRACFDIPFVGVVPAIKPAAQFSKTKRIGLLATPATVRRPYTDKLIADYADGCEVLRVGSSELVVLAENLLSGKPVSENQLAEIIAPFSSPLDESKKGKSIVDTVVLGCTHFPLLKTQLSKLLPGVIWVDSGNAIANRVASLLSGNELLPKNEQLSDATEDLINHQIYFSKTLPNASNFAQALENLGIKEHSLHHFSLMVSEPE